MAESAFAFELPKLLLATSTDDPSTVYEKNLGQHASSVPEAGRPGGIDLPSNSSKECAVTEVDIATVSRATSTGSIQSANFDAYHTARGDKSIRKRHPSLEVREYYKAQDNVLESFEEADKLIASNQQQGSELDSDILDDNDVPSAVLGLTKQEAFAINASLVANILLMALKIIVLIQSGSLAVLSSVVDSALDLFSAAVIWTTNRYMSKRNRYLYPLGKSRFEPLATVIIAAVMATAAIELVSKAIQELVDQKSSTELTVESVILLGLTVAIKVALFILCRSIKNSTSVSTLAIDHLNDSVSNSVAMFCAWIGSSYWGPADPIGAICIGAIIIINWYREGREHFLQLAGKGAGPQLIQRLTWVAMNHDERVLLVDTVRAIHFGANFLVEVDIVLPPEMPLHEAHDIGTLQAEDCITDVLGGLVETCTACKHTSTQHSASTVTVFHLHC
eukprot:m.421528 g.421528  ORF g.421528 m.421528 type:complete len:449 (+) comp21318_c2_seq3:80-1426(+)